MPKRTKWKHTRSFREYLAAKIMHDLGMATTAKEVAFVVGQSEYSLLRYVTNRFGRNRDAKAVDRISAAIVELEATIP